MGRFDSLKENTFSSNDDVASEKTEFERRRNRDTDRRKTNMPKHTSSMRPDNRRKQTASMASTPTAMIIKEEDFPEMITSTKQNTKELPSSEPISTESIWINAMKKREEDERNQEVLINQLNPKYWRGPMWVGPMLMRHTQHPSDWYEYIETAMRGHSNSFIVPSGKIEFSRDGKNWYNSWDETFSDEQLYHIRCEEDDVAYYEIVNILDEEYERTRNESYKYYIDTGELDGNAMAELERMAYEKYTEQFDYVEEETVQEADDIMWVENNEEYLEDD
jgi:hypothetical protein